MKPARFFALLVSLGAGSWVGAGCAAPPAFQPTTPKAGIYGAWPFDAKESAQRQDETAKALGVPKELVLDLGKKVTLKLVLIPPGRFLMGSPKDEKERLNEETQHEVIISKPFYMGIYAVTEEQYEQVMGMNPSDFKGATSPVECVSWEEASEFCRKLSQKAGKAVALPTESQWEYAGRCGPPSSRTWNVSPVRPLSRGGGAA